MLTDYAIRRARRLCLFSHWDPDGQVDDYVLHYLRELRDAGFSVVFVTTAVLRPEAVKRVEPFCGAVVPRENEGLDFGGWIECLRRWSDLQAELLLLCNDSVYGPFWSLREYIDALTATPADAYGALRSLGPPPHLQSWFLLLRPAAYRSPAFRTLMGTPVPPDLSKTEIIARYELRLSGLLEGEGLRLRAGFEPTEMGPVLARHPVDPAFALWREMLTERLTPFVKISLLRDWSVLVAGVRRSREVLEKINPEVAALAERNLTRRRMGLPAVRGRALRELARLPQYSLAQLPIASPLLVREVRTRPSPDRQTWLFNALARIWDVLRAPFARAYAFAGARRRTK